MKSIKYMWRNITRNKVRSGLTILSIGFSLALMTFLYGYLAMNDQWGGEAQKHHRIVVMSSQGFSGRVPISYVDRVRSMDGIQAAVPYAWFGGNYQDKPMPFSQFATDPTQVFEVWNEYTVDPEQLKAFQSDRQACIADRRLAERMKWTIGDKIPLQGTFYPVVLELKLVGVFDSPQATDSLWFDWTYLDELLKTKSTQAAGSSGTVFAKVAKPDEMANMCKSIDEKFESSDNPTRTQTEAAFAQMFTDMLGNVQAYIFFIGMAVVFSLILVAASSMAMSMRERTTEVAVLKAIGFSRGRVLWLVLGEACGIAILGGCLGISMGCLMLEGIHLAMPQFFPFSVAEMAGPWLLLLIAIACGIGLVSGIVPAIRASQISVIDGLRRVV